MKDLYRVEIPEPSARRLRTNVALVVRVSDGWGIFYEDEYRAEVGQVIEFEVDASATTPQDTRTVDGLQFQVFARYASQSGTRTEEIDLTPVKVSGEAVLA